jgi:hypothetical protein
MSDEQKPKVVPKPPKGEQPPQKKLSQKEAVLLVEKALLDLSQPGVLADRFNRVKVAQALKDLQSLK